MRRSLLTNDFASLMGAITNIITNRRYNVFYVQVDGHYDHYDDDYCEKPASKKRLREPALKTRLAIRPTVMPGNIKKRISLPAIAAMNQTM